MENRNDIPRRKNIWNLVLGLIFLSYGSYRLYTLYDAPGDNTLSMVLAVAFILFGFYDLYKYFKRL